MLPLIYEFLHFPPPPLPPSCPRTIQAVVPYWRPEIGLPDCESYERPVSLAALLCTQSCFVLVSFSIFLAAHFKLTTCNK